MAPERPPKEGPQFKKMMAEIESKLIKDGIDIPSRPDRAVREVAMKYELDIPLGGYPVRLPPELRKNAALGEAINEWYKERYGDRLKQNFSPGQTVVFIDGDLYAMRVPRIFGRVEFVLSREWLPKPVTSRGSATCNLMQLVDGMTPAKAASLSDAALCSIANAFERAWPAASTLESTDHKLMSIARGDVEVAVNRMMARGEQYGESKWASLQAAEKVLKAAIDLAGIKFRLTHGLAELCQTLADTGLSFDASAEVAAIQCGPGIRYGEEPCSRNEAVIAHHSSLELVNILREAGAMFSMNIDRPASSSGKRV
jgi:HEPN domain-containing protein